MTTTGRATAPPPGYPVRWESDVILKDGGTMHLRPILPTDDVAIRALVNRLSAQTIYLRFLSPGFTLSPRMLEHFVTVDYVDRLAFVGELGEEIIAVGRYERLPTNPASGRPAEAEVAFLVDDGHQRRGIGTILLEHLAAAGEDAGIGYFVADTLPENTSMLRVFHEAGFGDERTFGDGVVRVAFPIRPTAASVAAMHERERLASAESVHRLLAPGSVAVIGASRRPDTIGYRIVRNLLIAGFHGPVYPVNPDARHVAGVPAYPSVLHIPDGIDLAVVVVPAADVPGVVEQCARKRVRGLVVISGGFAEQGEEGWAAERRLVAEARRNGMRLIGPTCMGIVNTDPSISLNATFAPVPPRGQIGFISQSGGLGMVILDELARRGLGISTFVSAGNKADVSGNDLLSYWDDDPATEVILMYIESFGNPRTFARVARRVSRRKPIVAVKSGRSAAGFRAARMGNAAIQADNAVDALFRQTGVIRVDTLEELLDVGQVLAAGPTPAGRRVAIIGNAGGSGVLAADSCAAAGLDLPELRVAIRQRLADSACVVAVANPVALAPDAGPEDFERAIEIVLDDPGIDAIIAIYTSPTAVTLDEISSVIWAASVGHPDKPVLACALGHRGLISAGPERAHPSGSDVGTIVDLRPPDRRRRAIPFFAFAEAAANALGKVAGYAEWLSRPEGVLPSFADVDPAAARAVIAAVLAGAGGGVAPEASGSPVPPGASASDVWLDTAATVELLAAYRIPFLPTRLATSPAGAVEAAGQLGYPVVVKIDAPAAPLAPEARGTLVGLGDEAAVRAAADELMEPGVGRLIVQAMAPAGLDAVVEVTLDALFGPLLRLGTVGERHAQGAGRIAPLTDLDAAELVVTALERAVVDPATIDAVDVSAVSDVLLRVGRMIDDLPELVELELAPLIVSSRGAIGTSARVRVAPWESHPELALRRLRGSSAEPA